MLAKDILIDEFESIKNAFKQLDKTAEKVLLVVDNDKKLLGTITDGDIRRCILKGKDLTENISGIYNKRPTFIDEKDFSMETAKKLFLNNSVELIPILSGTHHITDFITWKGAFSKDKANSAGADTLGIPAVIMAGGKGARLEPFSRILPKPLIPIGDKPIIEVIVDEFRKYGVDKYYLTLNYKGKMIESYFDSLEKKDYKVDYLWDSEFSGTAGSLKLLKEKIRDTFIVSNCDVIVKADFKEVLSFHKRQKASLTVLSSMQHHKIPYGVVDIKEGGVVADIQEKPEYTFMINTGVYMVDKEALRLIPERSHFDMTDLIGALIEDNKKVITYPVNESDYIDVGQWENYKKTLYELSVL